MAKILVAPLNWGLGHATRDIPIIKELLARKHDVTIATSGRALELLKREFPKCKFIDFPDYPAQYPKSSLFVTNMTLRLPSILKSISREKRIAKDIIKKGRFDLVISDNRFGVYHEDVPSYFISHQLTFKLPKPLKRAEKLMKWFNSYNHLYFDGIIVPDFASDENLSGELSHFEKRKKRVYYAGILSSVTKKNVKEDIDYLFLISGPEPQRTELERIIREQVHMIKGKKIVLLGKPESESKEVLDDGTIVLSHASRKKIAELMNRAKFIIARSGYTTVMEIAELRKKALFIPTPGQTEQEYLSEYYEKKGFFHSVSQYKLDLAKDIEIAKKFSGFGKIRSTKENVKLLYDNIFRKHLDC